jgi:hypothetical protein
MYYCAEKCIKWGNTFDVSLESKNVVLDCVKPDGRKVCCTALNSTQDITRGIGIDYEKFSQSKDLNKRSKDGIKTKCEVLKSYISSPQEIRDFEFAKKLELILDPKDKLHELLSYVTSDETINNSTRWLKRVKDHMSSEQTPPLTSDDYEFLSRFEMTKVCGPDSLVIAQWTEWIEPITITARHPFGFGKCRNAALYFNKKPKVGRSDTDYVLLQSGYSLSNQSVMGLGGRRGKAKHYLLDAGTSTFDSSLFWFTCGYSQVHIYCDNSVLMLKLFFFWLEKDIV